MDDMRVPRAALRVASNALAHSLPYRTLAMKQGWKPKLWPRFSERDFAQLPITSKESYIKPLQLHDVISKNSVPEIAYASSGSSGTPTFWFRDEKTIAGGTAMHRFIFEHIFGIKPDEPTLVLVTFSMGLWVAGLFTADACRALRKEGFNITVVTPGIDQREGISALRELRQAYTHIVIAGYPPFVLDFLRASQRELNPIHPSTFVLTAGDKHTEEWRDEVEQLINREGESSRVINLYGSADAGAIAFETPFSIRLRRMAAQNPELHTRLFGDTLKAGGLFQFLPTQVFLETVGEELAITKEMPVPLVRYNIHDRGVIFDRGELGSFADESDRKQFDWNTLPLVSVVGRTDVAVTLYALNIYPENIAGGLPKELCTGAYQAFTKKENGKHSERLVVEVELREGVRDSEMTKDTIARALVESLKQTNTEFRKLEEELGEAAWPAITLLPFKTSFAGHLHAKNLIQHVGKKPRVANDSLMPAKTALAYFPNRVSERPETSEHEDAFDALEALAEKFRQAWTVPLIDNIEAITKISRTFSGTILDVGCGPGHITHALAENFNEARIVGIDISSTALKKAATQALSNTEFLKADVCKQLPLANNTVDLIVSKHTAHEFSDFGAAILEMMRVLKPGGYLYIEDLRRDMPIEFIQKAEAQKSLSSRKDSPEQNMARKMAELQYYSTRAAYTVAEISDILKPLNIEPLILAPANEILQYAITPGKERRYSQRGVDVSVLKSGMPTRLVLVIQKKA